MKRLDGQLAIITGGARGIGKGVCRIFCREGATVALWDILEEGEKTAEEIRAEGGSIFFQQVDITNKTMVQQAAEEVVHQHSRIDILINNAGIIRDRSFLKMTEEEWASVIDVNLNGLFHVTQAVLPFMKEAGYGRVVSASSVNALLGAFGQTNYAATKAAVIGFTKSLAREVGKYGITVNAVAPGYVQTEMTAQIPTKLLEAGIAQIPVGRIGTVEDIASAYLYLASREAGFVNGATLNINGGIID